MTTINTKTSLAPEVPLWRQRLAVTRKAFLSNWRIFAENRVGLLGFAGIMIFGLMAIGHPILMRTVWTETNVGIGVYDPLAGFDDSIQEHPAEPSRRHLLGTNPRGGDILSQLLYSTRWEFILGVTTALVTVFIATFVGAVAAYYGGAIDAVLMRLVDLIIMIPGLAILIVLSGLFQVGILQLALFLGILSGFGGAAIVIKSQALTVKVKPFIEAARVAGGSDFHIISNHIVPNLLPIALLYMMFTVTGAIFAEAVLSFLGLTEIEMSWGIMINQTRALGFMLDFDRWWLIFPASIAITALCASFYMVGRALDEVVNPRLRRR